MCVYVWPIKNKPYNKKRVAKTLENIMLKCKTQNKKHDVKNKIKTHYVKPQATIH